MYIYMYMYMCAKPLLSPVHLGNSKVVVFLFSAQLLPLQASRQAILKHGSLHMRYHNVGDGIVLPKGCILGHPAP